MNDNQPRIGLDVRGNSYFAARVDYHTGRPEIKKLQRFEKNDLSDGSLLENGQMILSLADSDVTIKKLHFPHHNGDIALKARFEMAQSLLEPESEYSFDLIETSRQYHYLGLIVRRSRLNDLFDRIKSVPALSTVPLAAQMRAVALFWGYLKYCNHVGGDLVALADFNGGEISLAFIYRGQISAVGAMPLDRFDLAKPEDHQRIGIEIKTVINFHLAVLFNEGISIPLSTLLVSGIDGDLRLLEAFGKYFTIPLARPEINPAYLVGQPHEDAIPFDNYLVALGLTVEPTLASVSEPKTVSK